MKNLILILLFFSVANQAIISQEKNDNLAGKNIETLKIIYINKNVSTHIISNEKINYADISVPDIIGDIPEENVLRIKPTKEGESGVITIITDRGFMQYMLLYSSDISKAYTRYNITYDDVINYMDSDVAMTKSEMYSWAYKMLVSNKKYYDVTSKQSLMKMTLNNIYSINKYFFIDLSLFNKSNIQFDIDEIRFKIEDKKQVKATNFQSVEITPIMQVNQDKSFKKSYRNIFVFEKFTFPGEKVFTIEINEKQISGRKIILRIDYTDVLNADNFTN